MRIVIEIDENVFTRLFDNVTEDYQIVNDDLFKIAKSIRKCTPLKPLGEEMRITQKAITDEKVLIGFNMAVALCNKHIGGDDNANRD